MGKEGKRKVKEGEGNFIFIFIFLAKWSRLFGYGDVFIRPK
jgi:hypothetical protein